MTVIEYRCDFGCCHVKWVNNGRGNYSYIEYNGERFLRNDLSMEVGIKSQALRGRMSSGVCLRQPLRVAGGPPFRSLKPDKLAERFCSLRW